MLCSNTPVIRVLCEEGATSTNDIVIMLKGVDIDYSGPQVTFAVQADHKGIGNIIIVIASGLDQSGEVVKSTLTTSGINNSAIRGFHQGEGEIDITVRDTQITTEDSTSRGVYVLHQGNGQILLKVSDTIITTKGRASEAIFANQDSENTDEGTDSNVSIEASSNTITTEGDRSIGIWGRSSGLADVKIATNSSSIITSGVLAHGIYGYHTVDGEGDITIISTDDEIITKGMRANGIIAYNRGSGEGDTNISIEVSSNTITTEGDRSIGIWGGRTNGSGDIKIVTNSSSIITSGVLALGIYGYHTGEGDITIISTDDEIITKGMGAHGIFAYHGGSGEDRSIDITIGGNIHVQGENSQGVRVGNLVSGNVIGSAPLDTEGYRKQTVSVDGSIHSDGIGVFLAGGGRVLIGSMGLIDSNSDSAILVTGDTPGEDLEGPITKPKLYLSINLDGRRVADIISDDGWIINDGGRTTIVVNGVKLHDSIKGVIPGAIAMDGIKEYRIRVEGVRIIDRTTDPWIISDPAVGVIADRDFSVADFIWGYAPRATIYEVLPDFLLHLNNQESRGKRIWSSDSPYWVRLSRNFWAYQPIRSTVGGEYRSSQNLFEAGRDFLLGENLVSSASISRIEGSADVSTTLGWGG